jgi:hypothetical protein
VANERNVDVARLRSHILDDGVIITSMSIAAKGTALIASANQEPTHP